MGLSCSKSLRKDMSASNSLSHVDILGCIITFRPKCISEKVGDGRMASNTIFQFAQIECLIFLSRFISVYKSIVLSLSGVCVQLLY